MQVRNEFWYIRLLGFLGQEMRHLRKEGFSPLHQISTAHSKLTFINAASLNHVPAPFCRWCVLEIRYHAALARINSNKTLLVNQLGNWGAVKIQKTLTQETSNKYNILLKLLAYSSVLFPVWPHDMKRITCAGGFHTSYWYEWNQWSFK